MEETQGQEYSKTCALKGKDEVDLLPGALRESGMAHRALEEIKKEAKRQQQAMARKQQQQQQQQQRQTSE